MGENVLLDYSKNILTPKICYESQKYRVSTRYTLTPCAFILKGKSFYVKW